MYGTCVIYLFARVFGMTASAVLLRLADDEEPPRRPHTYASLGASLSQDWRL
jgi:hypothetical protein